MSLREAFDELVDLPPQQRTERLRAMPLTDQERRRLESMLAETALPNELLDVPVFDVVENLQNEAGALERLIGTRIGPFTLVELIGEGGSAAVFRASRPAGSGEQLVALKLLRAGRFSSDGERRFRREQAILAQLTHPHVARLIEGGVDASGVPYIAMELVDGEPVTVAASARGLDLKARLGLFIDLCSAIDAAHASLIVHCDLKPSNVLVDRSGTLKVLDFGVARLIDASQDGDVTRTIALTPEYAAPEQYVVGPPKVSVDIYALGVLLGELLTGQRLGTRTRTTASAAVAQAAAPEPPTGLPGRAALARLLSGDLDAIIATATSASADERYRSVGALARDVERYLAGRPVEVRPGSYWTRALKFTRRHRLAVSATALTVLAILSSAGLAWWQAVKAQRAATVALEESKRADSIRKLVFDLLTEAEPGGPRSDDTTVTEAAERAVGALVADTTTPPRTRLELLVRFADTLGRQGHARRAEEILTQTLATAEKEFGPDDRATLAVMERLASYEIQRGEFAAARRRIDALLPKVPADDLELRIGALRTSASLGWHVHDKERALRDGRESVALSRTSGNADTEQVTLTYFAAVLLGVDEVDEAIGAYEKLLAMNVAKYGAVHEKVSLAYSGLARAYRRSGDLDRSVEAARKAIEIDRAVFPGDHWVTANHLNALSMTLIQKHDLGAALDAAQKGLEICANTLDENHIDRLVAEHQVGAVLGMMERFTEALPYVRHVVDRYDVIRGPAAYETTFARQNLGYALGMSGSVAEGVAQLDTAIADIERAFPAAFDPLAKALEKRTRVAIHAGDYAQAALLVERLAGAVARVSTGERRWWLGRAETMRGEILLASRRFDDAKTSLLAAGVALQDKNADPAVHAEQELLLAAALAGLGDQAAALKAAQDGRNLLQNLSYPPARVVALEKTLPR